MVKNVNGICIIDLRSHVIARRGNVSDEILVYNKITACGKQICVLGVICRVSDRKTLSNENVCFVGNACYQLLLFSQNIFPILIG